VAVRVKNGLVRSSDHETTSASYLDILEQMAEATWSIKVEDRHVEADCFCLQASRNCRFSTKQASTGQV